MTKQELLLQTFQSKFDLTQYKKFIIEFFNDAKLLNGEKRNDYWNWNEYSFYINGYYHVADYLDEKRNKIAIFAVELKKGKSLEKARSKQRNFIADRIKVMGYDGAIAAFYSEDEKENRWRLSFVRLDYELLKGKIKTNFTPAKRYSYLLGVDEPCHTAMQQLYPILEEEKFNPSIDKLEEAFSVEKVTKQFFEKYKEKYIELYEYLSDNETFVDEAIRCVRSDKEEDISKFTEQFAKKLMGQIVFMYFLQKKGWLGVNAFPPKISEREYKNSFFNCNNEHKEIMKKLYLLDSDGNYVRQSGEISALSEEQQTYFASRIKGMPWETGPKNFVRILFKEADKYKRNYFEYYLEPLFYEALNEKRGADNYYARLHCRIPFLNGGLFEPLDGYDWKNNNFSIPNEIFSNASIKGDREADGILDIFDRYNFTMNEDEPLEKEVAVDPEMLGKIFENLLDVKDRKSKGAFYTPREIVHYMCQESLINYIVNTVGTPYEDTKDFILYGEIMKDEDCSREVKDGYAEMLMPESIYKNLKAIDDALADVRVADPAVGSGAFPMGMVNEIVKARENITAYFARELTSNAQKHQLWNYTRHPYMLKKDAMKNSIFAVDIEPSAVDITKLRLWLSLVVEFDINSDNDEFKNPPTLPNLECNILCGNSLIDEFEGVKLFNDSLLTGASSNSNWMADLFQNQVDSTLTKLIDKQKELFYANNHDDKYRLKREIDVLQQQVIFASCTMTDDIKERFISSFVMPSKPYILWKLAFAKVFKDKGGFDIVIGNPPYVQLQKAISEDGKIKLGDLYEKCKFQSYTKTGDLYCLFYEQGYRLLKNKGTLSFITSNKWMRAGYGEKLRSFFANNTNPLLLIDFAGQKIFETATVDVNILVFEKSKNSCKTISCIAKEECRNNLDSYIFNHSCKIAFDSSDSWVILSSLEHSIKSKIEKLGCPLQNWNLNINRGILTGLNEAFIIDNNTKENLIAEDSKSIEVIKPLLRGRDIKRYNCNFADLWLINIHNGIKEKNINRIDIKDYPAIKKHLDKYYNQLSVRTDKGDTPYNLRNCAYLDDFSKEKLIYPETTQGAYFVYDDGKYVIDKTCFMITGTNNLLYLQATLSSMLFQFAYKKIFSSIELGTTGYQYNKHALILLPVIEESKLEASKVLRIEQLAKEIAKNQKEGENTVVLENEMNKIIYNLYDLTPEEIALVEEAVK